MEEENKSIKIGKMCTYFEPVYINLNLEELDGWDMQPEWEKL